jgi:hypothetical protein
MCLRLRSVIDTVELFRVERQRKLSLRFLASVLLGANIQSEVRVVRCFLCA